MGDLTCEKCSQNFENKGAHTMHMRYSETCKNRKQILRLYKAGNSVKEVAKEVGLNPQNVKKFLRNTGNIRGYSEANRIAWDNKRKDAPSPDLNIDPDLSWLTAVLHTDGNVSESRNRYVIRLGVIDKEFADEFDRVLEERGLNTSRFVQSRNGVQDQYNVKANSKKFFQWWESLGIGGKKDMWDEYPLMFLRGFYDSDGSLHKSHERWRVSLYRQEEWLLEYSKKKIHSEIGVRVYGPYTSGKTWSISIRGKEDVQNFCCSVKPTIPRKDVQHRKVD